MEWWILRAKAAGDASGGADEGGAGDGGGNDTPAPKVWEQELPADERPEVWKSYKTFADAAKAHHELRTELTNRAARQATADAELKKTKEELAAHNKRQEQATTQAKLSENTKLWQESVDAYSANEGAADPELITKLVQATGLSEQMILDVHQKHHDDRTRFIAQVKEAHPDFDVDSVRAWVESGESPISEGMLHAFYWLAEKGDIGWVKHVKDMYAEHLKNGGRQPLRKGTSRRPGAPPLQGRPAFVEPDVFKTRVEYHQALVAAHATGDRANVDAVYKKLERSQTEKW